ncbi:hypothetical protein [Chitinophaga vietnamensis]|uniref:hypothetical protein n=1 Tax=Chitinophaga vietnamensis TaxID=2593957 RepID=UPI0013763777|nr:hypothetical protein [Chitinophaga vietnamensis]
MLLPGRKLKPKNGTYYEVHFGYLEGDLLGYRQKIIETSDELVSCIEILVKHL